MAKTLLGIGTSVTWGQGLLTEQKFASLVAKELGLELRLYARSGARLWRDGPAQDYPHRLAKAA